MAPIMNIIMVPTEKSMLQNDLLTYREVLSESAVTNGVKIYARINPQINGKHMSEKSAKKR